MFGLKVRDAEFFKQSEEILKNFIIKDQPKKGKVSDEEKDKKDDSEVK